LEADGRFTSAVSEWGCDPASGWTMVGADGQTRMNVGWSDLTRRAGYVSALLARPDTILAVPCAIDARFEGQLVVSRLAMLDDTTAIGDSGKSAAVRPQRSIAKTKGTPEKLAFGASLGTMPASAKPKVASRPTRSAKAVVTSPQKSTKSMKSTKPTKSTTHTKKHARRGGA
jgi:hypothetical protein